MTDAYAELEGIEEDGNMEVVSLVSNDIDVFCGELTGDKTNHLFVEKRSIKEFSI